MTPAVETARQAGVTVKVHTYRHDPNASSYGLEAAEALGLPVEQVFKTLLLDQDGAGKRLAVAIIPVHRQLNLKRCAKALGAKRLGMASPSHAERSTGYVVGGISPLGQKRRLPTVLDQSASGFDTIYVSGGKRGLDIELAPADLCQLTSGTLANIAE